MKLNQDGLLAKYLSRKIEKEKKRSREQPVMPFIGEKKQMWYFLMNQIDEKNPEDAEKPDGVQN
ncbi:MAG: hypothetical protein ACI4O6_03525 [Dysosmobacter sp.]